LRVPLPATDPSERDRALYLAGLAAFERGDYYASHDLLEDLWLRNRSELRPFFQGLIQLAAAFHHLAGGRYVGAMALFRAGAARLAPFAPVTLGLDVARLLLETEACRVHAEGLGPHRLDAFDWTLRARAGVEPPTPTAFWPHRGVAPHPLSRVLVAGR
jgi:hypothetical protein